MAQDGDVVTLINAFEVPEGKEQAAIEAWDKANEFLQQQPGYVSTALHRSLDPGARFRLVNVAKWASADEYVAAVTKMREAGVYPQIEGLGINPALYEVIRGGN